MDTREDDPVAAYAALREAALACTRCALATTRTQVVFGSGGPGARLLFVGEAPGAQEDAEGVPFVGRSGQLLRRVCEDVGIVPAATAIVNVVKCRPPENRDPNADEVAACVPWLERQIALLAPAVIVTLGNHATRHVLGTRDGITQLRGRVHEVGGAVVVPTFHPAAVLRGGAARERDLRDDLELARRRMVAAAHVGDAGD